MFKKSRGHNMSKLEDLIEIYQTAKQNNKNPQDLTSYVINYIMSREYGFNHNLALQKLKLDYDLIKIRK